MLVNLNIQLGLGLGRQSPHSFINSKRVELRRCIPGNQQKDLKVAGLYRGGRKNLAGELAAMASTSVLPPEMALPAASGRPVGIEELCFTSAMSCFEGWLKLDPAIGPRTMVYVTKFISRTLEKTHNLKEVR